MTLAELHQRYLIEVDAFNANPPDDSAEFTRVAATTRLLRTSVRTKADALAALALLEEEVDDAGALNSVCKPLFTRLRSYIKGQQS